MMWPNCFCHQTSLQASNAVNDVLCADELNIVNRTVYWFTGYIECNEQSSFKFKLMLSQ
jgi:hypothetical protein